MSLVHLAPARARLRPLLCFILAAAASLITTLTFPHVGEEGVYTISSQEMLQSHRYHIASLYGQVYPRPPLYNWCILALHTIIGDPSMLLSARIVTMLASLGMVYLTYTACYACSRNKLLSLWSAAILLSGDFILRRAWIAYADPVFALWSTSSMWLLLQASQQRCYQKLFIANLWLLLAVFTKVATSFIFYGGTAIAYYYGYSRNQAARRELLRFWLDYKSLMLHMLPIGLYLLWNQLHTAGSCSATYENITSLLLHHITWRTCIAWLSFLPKLLMLWLPCSALVLYYILRWPDCRHKLLVACKKQPWIRVLLWILILNLIPYWLASRWQARYLLPLYPCCAILLAATINKLPAVAQRYSYVLLCVCLAVKFILAGCWYPYETTAMRGNARLIAKEILQLTASGQALYITDSNAGGLRVAAEINSMLPAGQLLQLPPSKHAMPIFLLVEALHANQQLIKTFKLGGEAVYLVQEAAQP
jgi:hypothetical protein